MSDKPTISSFEDIFDAMPSSLMIIEGMKKTLASLHLQRMFIEIHPFKIESDAMQSFFKQLQMSGFEIEAAISRDNWQRSVLGQCKVEHMCLAELAQDSRILNRQHAFEVFFKRIRQP